MIGTWEKLDDGKVRKQIVVLLPAIRELMGDQKELYITVLDPKDGATLSEYNIGDPDLIEQKGYDMRANQVAQDSFRRRNNLFLFDKPVAVASWAFGLVVAASADLTLERLRAITMIIAYQLNGLYFKD